jgi:hypothetical protein
VHNNNVGFVTLTQEGTSMTVSFAGKYLTMGPGDKLCYTVVDKERRVVGCDLRKAPVLLYTLTGAPSVEETREAAHRLCDGSVAVVVPNSVPHGMAGEGYIDPDLRLGTVCVVGKDGRFLYISTHDSTDKRPFISYQGFHMSIGTAACDAVGAPPVPVPLRRKRVAPRRRSTTPNRKRARK